MNTETVNTGWQFEIGAMVTHREQVMPSLVTGRVRTCKGREVYGVRRMEACEVPDLMILGEVLQPA